MAEYNPYQAPVADLDAGPVAASGDTQHPPPSTLARGVCVGLAFALASDLVAAWAYFSQNGFLQRALTGDVTMAEAEANDVMVGGAVGVSVVATIAVAIAFLIWIARANRTARSLAPNVVSNTPGWAVGWWFIPFANLWKPYGAVKEIYAASVAHDPRRWNEIPAVFPLWWAGWIIPTVLNRVASQIAKQEGAGIDDMMTATQFALAAHGLLVLDAALAIAVVLAVTRAQEQAWRGRGG